MTLRTIFLSYFYVTVIKYPDQKVLKGGCVYIFSFKFQRGMHSVMMGRCSSRDRVAPPSPCVDSPEAERERGRERWRGGRGEGAREGTSM